MTGGEIVEPWLEPETVAAFADDARRAVYDAIALRRDVRHFRADRDVDQDVLERVLGAAHLAPSVGFSQPWGFVVIRDRALRQAIRESFLRCREAEAARYPEDRRERYLAYRLEGILEAPVNVCVAVDLRPRGEAILGTTAQPEAVRASACCAVQNLWLAARVEGLGVGWVSIVEPAVLRQMLGLPGGVEPIAYLCVGHPIAFRARPMLEEGGWRGRRALASVVHPDGRWRDAVEAFSEAPADAGGHAARSQGCVPSVEANKTVAKPSSVIRITPPDPGAYRAASTHQAMLVKPTGSLGRLEEIAAWYASARGRFPAAPPKRAAVVVFAADHGVAAEGVSAYSSSLTAAVVGNVMAGGAAINAMAHAAAIDLSLVDVGIAGDRSGWPVRPLVPVVSRRVRAGTGNLRYEPAMTRDEAEAALRAGAAAAADLITTGVDLLGVGEVGIGNTTAAAALVCAFTGAAPNDAVGRGTGISSVVRERKVRVVADALALHRARELDVRGILAAVGGLEIAALAGAMLEAARARVPIVLDGFVTLAAALAAAAIDEGIRGYWLASHASVEPGARVALDALGLVPLVDWGLGLGEGTGAALAIPIVRTAVETQLAMATFATAGIVGRAGTEVDP